MRARSNHSKVVTIIDSILIIACFLFLAHHVVSAPTVNPYDNYNLTTYNCLDIAVETQEWNAFNGVETIVFVGCFNDTLCHAWVEDTSGRKITGFVEEWIYEYIYIYDRR